MSAGVESAGLDQVAVALDTNDRATFERWCALFGPRVGVLKVGLEAFVRWGPPAIEIARQHARALFLDLKLHDIPNTVAGAVRSARELAVDFLTIHAAGGPAMIAAAAEAADGRVALLAVTVLTHLDEPTLERLDLPGGSSRRALLWAHLARQAGASGVVCSPLELAALRAAEPRPFKLVAPGIRPAGPAPGASGDDQRRTATAAAAIASGADLIVMTGDYVCWRRHEVEAAREQLAGLRAPRVLTVLGNHDYFTHARGMTAALVDQGYEVLRNQHTVVELRGAPLTVVGIDDPVTRHHDVEAAFAGVARRAGSLVLCHAPDAAPGLARAGAGLVLSGHTHGGQIYVPGVTDRIMRRLGLNYRGGHYAVGDTTALYVTPGVGFSGVTHRVGPGTAAEVALLTLRAPRATAPAGTARSAGATAAAG